MLFDAQSTENTQRDLQQSQFICDKIMMLNLPSTSCYRMNNQCAKILFSADN